MLADTGYVRVLRVGNGVILEGTGFFDDDVKNDTRLATLGSWTRDDGGAADPWFGTTANVVSRYLKTGAAVRTSSQTDPSGYTLSGVHTYTWHDGVLCGRFPSNENAWWYYFIPKSILCMGTDATDDPVEISETADQLPWLDLVDISQVRQILTEGKEQGLFEIDNIDIMADILHYCIKGIEVPYIRGQIGEELEENKGWEYVAKIVYGALGRKGVPGQK